MRRKERLAGLLGILGVVVLAANCTKPVVVRYCPKPTVSPTSTVTSAPVGRCAKLEVPAFLIDQREVSGTVYLSAPAHLTPKVILSPEGCKAELLYRWFWDGEQMREYDDFVTIPLNPRYLPPGEHTLRVVIYMKSIGESAEASIKIVVSE
jgi:hypothetical protein